MRVLLPLLLCAPLTATAGEPVLVPDFTPASTSEFAVAFELQEQVIAALNAAGHVVLTQDLAHPVVGDALMGCADVPSCPTVPMQKLPARLAVVVTVSRFDSQLVGRFAVYEASDDAPFDEREITFSASDASPLSIEVVASVNEVISLLPPPVPGQMENAARLVAHLPLLTTPPPASVPTPSRPTPVAPPPDTQRAPPPPPPLPEVPKPPPVDYLSAPLDDLLGESGLHPRHLVGSERSFRAAGMDPRDWLYQAMPHAGRFIMEMRGGAGSGDVDRAADVRIELDADGAQVGTWFQEGPLAQSRVRGGIFLGYAPTTWIDLGAMFGLQYGQRALSTGYRRPNGDEQSSPIETVQAVQLYVQPRLRLYPLTTGPAKPYLVAGLDLRWFDRWTIAQPAGLAYPTPPGGLMPGPLGGLGVLIDTGPAVGFVAEGAFTWHTGIRSAAAESGQWSGATPDPPLGKHYTLAWTGGVQVRL